MLFANENDDASESQIEYWRERPQVAPVLLAITCHPNQQKIHKIPLWEQVYLAERSARIFSMVCMRLALHTMVDRVASLPS